VSTQQQYERGPRPEEPSGWAVGGLAFAGTMMILIGCFQAIAGIVAIANDNFYTIRAHYTFDLDTTGWGWIHLIIGILVLIAGFSLFARRPWAGITAVMLAGLSAVANFFFIPYYPFWSIVVIALDVWVIWALTRPGVIRT
jgi:uncharacterized membrane protein HdeD (DUF308 family)